ncbi:MAG: hypothetical protein ACOH1O_02725 [Flavobacterium sp.]
MSISSNPTVTLQTTITIVDGELVTVRWKLEGGKINIDNGILSLVGSS